MTEEQDQKPVRVAISKRLRFEVFKRDRFECQYCGQTPPAVVLHCDHIVPVSEGGETSLDNLVTACQPCNLGKSNIRLDQVPLSLAERSAEVIEREAQIAGYEAVLKERRMRLEAEAEEVLGLYCDLWRQDGIRKDWFTSIKRFVEQLGLDQCLWAMERAHQQYRYAHRKGFSYFCGICWNKIRDKEGQ